MVENNESFKIQKIFLPVLVLILIVTYGGLYFVHGRISSSMMIPKYKSIFESNTEIDESSLPATLLPTAPEVPAATHNSHDYSIPPIVNGLVPVLSKIPTKEPVVFLGIDDGANKKADELTIMKDNGIKASLFLSDRFINTNRAFFKDFIGEGSLIENHTTDHKLLSNLTYADQKTEICGMADLELKEYGRKPVLLRPPGGDYNTDTLKAAADCGMKALIIWDSKANGGVMQYQNARNLSAGDIVLMHFRPEFQKDMQAFIDASKAYGLHTELLEDWL